MELKYKFAPHTFEEFKGFNRTFMELKLMFPMFCNTEDTSFNRTFMELKCIAADWDYTKKEVF